MVTVRFQLRRDTAGNWSSVNPTLSSGEPAIETDTRKVKFGDGTSPWNMLPYFTGGGVTSVAASGGSTGLSFVGSPITGAGTLTLSGTLDETAGGTGLSSYIAGDMIYAVSGTVLARLGIGTNGSVLTSNGSLPSWTGSTGADDIVRKTRPQFTNAIGVGTAAATSGSGVSFPAAQSPSTDPNTLDDYEEGTWTPTVTAGSGIITAYTAAGYYTKIGRKVDITVVINITTNGTGAGSLRFTLPFTAASGPAWVNAGRDTSAGIMLQTIITSAGAFATVVTSANGYPGGDSKTLVATISYFV